MYFIAIVGITGSYSSQNQLTLACPTTPTFLNSEPGMGLLALGFSSLVRRYSATDVPALLPILRKNVLSIPSTTAITATIAARTGPSPPCAKSMSAQTRRDDRARGAAAHGRACSGGAARCGCAAGISRGIDCAWVARMERWGRPLRTTLGSAIGGAFNLMINKPLTPRESRMRWLHKFAGPPGRLMIERATALATHQRPQERKGTWYHIGNSKILSTNPKLFLKGINQIHALVPSFWGPVGGSEKSRNPASAAPYHREQDWIAVAGRMKQPQAHDEKR
ncbi:hypothetical protein F5148DRAFT_1309723 [Russula earlei]|uniref:Uncharacterized protein n=1 Tax=Russula earlei TaxID=71964 RepID=A0ACC0U730_9AGAM|nr:hypothetical protein F5148DRAFT_1309723 [Russula earlei]